jgi:hypothetical protein
MRSTFSVMFFLLASTAAIAQAYLYSDTSYHISGNKSEVFIIQNSLPKGGRYTDPAGKDFGCVIFWTRVRNETGVPLELTVNFPAEAFTDLLIAGSVFKIFLPTDTMTLDKEPLYNFGATGLKSFLDAGLNKPTTLKRIINPKEDCFFYIGFLIHAMPPNNGALRTGLVLKGKELFYRIRLSDQPDATLVACGQIVFKK